MSEAADPFGTSALRAAVLAAWRDSPTRLREDAATENDLVRAGYRDRLLTELAQNAADAARKAGVAGAVVVRLDGRDLYIGNTGAPLDVSGVHALTALRASGKSAGEIVGRFGVGFTAVLAVSEDIEVRSVSGSLRFSRAETREALRRNGIRIPEGAAGEFVPPALRLAWPTEARPPDGLDTEVVLRLRADVDAGALLAAMRAEAVDLLLELPALHRIRIGADELVSSAEDMGGGMHEVYVDGPGDVQRTWWQYRTPRARWLLPVRDGRPVAAAPDVLRAPTRSDEELSLPALLVADIPMQPDRRRLLPGARLAELADGYAEFARALPPRDRLVLVPAPGFARSEADGLLREALLRELRTHPWLPVTATHRRTDREGSYDTSPLAVDLEPFTAAYAESASLADHEPRQRDAEAAAHTGPPDEPVVEPADASGGRARAAIQASDGSSAGFGAEPGDIRTAEPIDASSGISAPAEPGASGIPEPPSTPAPPRPQDVAVPTRAYVFAGLTSELADLLDEVVGPLVIPDLSGRPHTEAMAVLDVHRLGLARLAELSGGLDRPPSWWRSFYAALEPFAGDPLAAEELGALAVPLADGRLVTGPRTVVLDDQLEVAIPVHWARLAHPEAAHPLLARLGARSATAEDLLIDPGLRADLEDHPDDPDTADAVLRLAAHADREALPPWLSSLELPDVEGDLRPADELLLPGAPLRELLVPDAPFGTADPELVDRYGADALRAVGVGWDFSVVVEADPTGPDHDLDDEEHWWSTLADDPPELVAVRDLDLIDDAAWPEALRQLAATPRTRRLLADADGYTAWWLRRYARIDSTPLGLFRHPADVEFDGLLPAFAVAGVDPDACRAVLADPETITEELAAALLEALGDSSRTPSAEVVSRTHARLAAAVAADRLDLADLRPPDRVRALSGVVADPADVFVLDRPWFGLVVPADRLVVGDTETASALAALLDLPLASEAVTAEVIDTGRRTTWPAEPLGVVLRQLFALTAQAGELVVHHDLTVRLSGAIEATVAVPWWQTDSAVHVQAPHLRG
ncbi:sacsin N-terminal ATP-binding-like domain-containing protein [Nocardia sputorum]|uniref:sacsin N-terminal ATP-binding-like domain-containing protein n=1 Tax=Nocardia sputorum TaxID=2984338 RepID=UPI0024902F1F|nr:ATP-binding protein [Nocardia sputorum]